MIRIIFVLLITLFLHELAFSKTCIIPNNLDNKTSGDEQYSNIMGCDKHYIDKYWDDFNMLKWNWNDGFGYYDVCNNNLPLGRMLNAIFVLDKTKNIHYKKSILNWAYDYAEGDIITLSAGCGDGTLNAQNILAKVTFYMDGFYGGKSVVRRAGILLHEARHTRRIHNGWGNCPSGASCDSSWEYQGANQYQVLWLWWFGRHSVHTTKALKNDALRDARWRHDNRFNQNPGKNI
jgi:hypothetical protein